MWFVYSKLFFFLYLTLQLLTLFLNVLAFRTIEINILIMILLTISSMILCLTDNFINKRQSFILFLFKVVSYVLTFTIISHHLDTVLFFLSKQSIDHVEIIIKLITVVVYYEMAIQYLDRFLRIKIDLALRQKTPYVILILIKVILAIASVSVIIVWVFKIELIPVVYTSSAITGIVIIVLTQMMKRSISNFFSGLFLILSNPFKIGDIISVNENTMGFVKDFNWRGVSINSLNGDTAQVPNEIMLNSKITNHTKMNEESKSTSIGKCIFYFDSTINPDYIKKIIDDSMSIITPRDNIEYKHETRVFVPTTPLSQRETSIEYNLCFHSKYKNIGSEAQRLTRVVLSNLSCYGITQYKQIKAIDELVISPLHKTYRHRQTEILANLVISNLKHVFPIFNSINRDLLRKVINPNNISFYKEEANILMENKENEYLFLVLVGAVKITKLNIGTIQKLCVSGIFGEISALLGEKSIHSVQALKDSAILKIDKEILKKIIHGHPSVQDSLSFILENRLKKEEKIKDKLSLKNQNLTEKNSTVENIKRALLNFFGKEE